MSVAVAQKTEKYPCVKCFVDTVHEVLLETTESDVTPDDISWITTTKIIQCGGCKQISIREEFECSEYTPGGTIITYHPPRVKRRKPDWIDKLEDHAPDLVELFIEIYAAANHRHHRLLAMGIRSVMDQVTTRLVGDIGGFEQKLDALVDEKIISEVQRALFDTVIDGASAAAHRGYKPPWDLLENMLTLMEFIVNQTYISGPMLEAARKHIPPRPPRAEPQ